MTSIAGPTEHAAAKTAIIGATTPASSLPPGAGRICAEWDQGYYPTGIKITDEQLAAVPLTGHDWHPNWNYDITTPPAQHERTTSK